MDTNMIYEIIGYAASVLVAVSLMMSSIVKLRIINFVGSVTFSIYGFLIGAMPVGFMNAAIALFNIYHLYNLTKKEDSFKVKTYNTVESEVLNVFFEFYEEDIKNFFPNFSDDMKAVKEKDQYSIVTYRNNVPAGVLVGFKDGENLNIVADYVIPEYRDFKLAKYIYTEKKVSLLNENIKKIVTVTNVKYHQKYLKKLNFSEVTANRFELIL